MIAISELARVLKSQGKLVIEFENSWGYEYIGTTAYKKNADVISLKYYNQNHIQWVYSFNYIKKILGAYEIKIYDAYEFHIISSYFYQKYKDENKAAKYSKFDRIFRYFPIINKHSSNIILGCKKL